MERRKHIERMRETAAVVIPLIIKAYKQRYQGVPYIDRGMRLFLDSRTAERQPLLRPYFVRLAYEICGGRDWIRIAPACAAAEIMNISSYQANVAFDGKLLVSSQEERAEQYACSMISLQYAQSVLLGMHLDNNTLCKILVEMQQANSEIYSGQILDITELQLTKILSMCVGPDVFRIYQLRCLKLGGEFTAWCLRLGGILAGYTQDQLECLDIIGKEMGIAGQMVNDIGDLVTVKDSCVANQSHRYQHAYSDLLNGKTTYPTLHAFAIGDSKACSQAIQIYKQQIIDPSIWSKYTARLLRIGAFEQARKEIRKHYNAAKQVLGKFSERDERRYFALALTTLTHNKYFTALRICDNASQINCIKRRNDITKRDSERTYK